MAPRKLAVYSFSFGALLCYVLVETFNFLLASFFLLFIHSFILSFFLSLCIYLPARASEQGNVIGLVSVYIYIYIYIVVIKKKL